MRLEFIACKYRHFYREEVFPVAFFRHGQVKRGKRQRRKEVMSKEKAGRAEAFVQQRVLTSADFCTPRHRRYHNVRNQLAISEMNLMRTRRTSSSVNSSPSSSRAVSMSSVVDSLK